MTLAAKLYSWLALSESLSIWMDYLEPKADKCQSFIDAYSRK